MLSDGVGDAVMIVAEEEKDAARVSAAVVNAETDTELEGSGDDDSECVVEGVREKKGDREEEGEVDS